MKNRTSALFLSLFISILFWSCSPKNNGSTTPDATASNLTIFFVNDQHGQLENFAKIKYIVEEEEKTTNVIVACAGDMFSGNPYVDHHPEKGYPMIDLMNEAGFDISVLGNHEFDYGQDVLKDRMEQADFDWVCANVDMQETVVPEPFEYKTLTVDGLTVTFLGLVETYGKEGATIPSTHPTKVEGILFQRAESVVGDYADVKAKENSDLYIALTHLGHYADYGLANNHPYFDLIIGGHSHWRIDTVVNSIPIFQSGSYLNHLGKIELKLENKKVKSINYELIDLSDYENFDSDLKVKIDSYNNLPEFDEVIGYSAIHHTENRTVGCFYTDAIRGQMDVDVAFQNSGGIRDDLNEGDITKGEIYAISPFNNGMLIYSMTVSDVKNFLTGSGAGFYYSGIVIDQTDGVIIIKDQSGNILDDNHNLSVCVNDYTVAVHEDLFSDDGELQEMTDAETLIAWLESHQQPINYPDCNRFFRYQSSPSE